MLRKRCMVITLAVISVFLGSPFYTNSTQASSETRVYVDPPTTVAETGDYFTISIMIEDVTNLFAWEFFLSWDTEILYTDETMITEGDFLNQGVPYPTTFVKKVYGYYMQVSCTLQLQMGISGSGTLAQIQFKVVGPGKCSIKLYNTTLRDPMGAPIDHTSESGVFHTTYPVAFFFYYPSSSSFGGRVPPELLRNPYAGESVAFNASESYDPNGWLDSYIWDFGDDTPPITVENVTDTTYWLINHTYTQTGDYLVTLNVTDNEGKTSSKTESVTVDLHDLVITNIEVYPTTINPGKEPFPRIEITVLNNGTVGEYFNLTLYYDNNPIWYNKTIGWKAYMYYKYDEEGRDRASLNRNQNITITFTWNTTGVAEGTYNITANVTRMHGGGTFFLPGEYEPADNFYNYGEVYVTLGAPVANFAFTPEHPRKDETVIFDASESYDPNGWLVSYTWDFGDGTPPITVENVTGTTYWLINHTYPSVETYTVILTITDNDGLPATFRDTLKVSIHDVEIKRITLSKTSVDVGESLSIDVRVRNSGGFDETFNVTAYYDGNIIGTYANIQLEPGEVTVKTFTWNTTGSSIGTYIISANTSVIPYDITPENNIRASEENVTLTAHDIAITDVRLSSTSVEVGESLTIDVDVTNQGSFDETFDVNLYYDSVLIETQTGVALSTGASTTLTFTWNTTDVSEGNYTLKAEVPQVSGETDTADNLFTDGTVTIQAPEQPPEQPEQPGIPLYVIAGVAGIAIIILAAILFYFMKVRKPK